MVKQFGSWECIWVISLVLFLSYFFQEASHNIDAIAVYAIADASLSLSLAKFFQFKPQKKIADDAVLIDDPNRLKVCQVSTHSLALPSPPLLLSVATFFFINK
jgi:hypothetical protein